MAAVLLPAASARAQATVSTPAATPSAATPTQALALPAVLRGTQPIHLHDREGRAVRIGQVRFEPMADGRQRFALQIQHEPFRDYFLSMREFKCLEGASEILCHVPYPYSRPDTVATGEYAWLEHALLFMFKRPADFGAKLWNGVYWRLRLEDGRLVGLPQAVDLQQIAAPPARPDVPPYPASKRDDMSPSSRWFVRLTIG
jgi:hypothetical protein